jgi:hypothetical protein
VLHAIAQALTRHGVTVLENEVVSPGGVSILGANYYRNRLHPERGFRGAFNALLASPAPRIVVAHSPDIMNQITRPIDLMLAGHTHCGQIVLPFYGAINKKPPIDWTLACGHHGLGRFDLIVTGGVGTSRLPMRFLAPPDFWVLNLSPA